MAVWDPPKLAGELEELRRQFPGRQIWASGNTWCARPEPLINCGSAEELAERIKTAHRAPPDGSPSLASWRSYRARVRHRPAGHHLLAQAPYRRELERPRFLRRFRAHLRHAAHKTVNADRPPKIPPTSEA